MSSAIKQESPLVRFALEARAASTTAKAGIISTERPFLGHINLRGDAGDPGFVAAVAKVAGIDVPAVPNTVVHGQGNTAYWMGPNEWLIVTPGEQVVALERDLRIALAGFHAAVTEVTGGQTVVSLRGEAVRDLLAKGCPLDLHPRAFGVDRCAQSHLAKAPILIHQADASPSFDIIVRRSFADYFWLWLEDAAEEYGHRVEASASAAKFGNIV